MIRPESRHQKRAKVQDPISGRHTAARARMLSPSLIDGAVIPRASDPVDLAIGSSELTPPIFAQATDSVDGRKYSPPEGIPALRSAIAASIQRRLGVDVDAERHVTVTCGATEGLLTSLMTLLEPGDEVVLFEPYYEGYLSAVRLAGGQPRFVRLHRPNWSIEPSELSGSFSVRTKAIILNSPHNPTGKVFTQEELSLILNECYLHRAICISDEVYDGMVFDGLQHLSPFAVAEAKPWTILLNSMSKTYHAAGWRIGYMVTPDDLSETMRMVHGVMSYCAPEPLQTCAVSAYKLPNDYYDSLSREMQRRRDRLIDILSRAGITAFTPRGAMYVLSDVPGRSFASDIEFTDFLLTELGIACVPGRCFYGEQKPVEDMVRFCFARSDRTLDVVSERLGMLGDHAAL